MKPALAYELKMSGKEFDRIMGEVLRAKPKASKPKKAKGKKKKANK